LEHAKSLCEDENVNNKLLLLDKKFVEEPKISSNHAERMQHIAKNCEDAFMDKDSLFLDKLVGSKI